MSLANFMCIAYARQVWKEMDRLTWVRVGWQGSSLLKSSLLVGKISKILKNLNPSFELLTRVIKFWLVRNHRILENRCIHAFQCASQCRSNISSYKCPPKNMPQRKLNHEPTEKVKGLGATLMVPVKVNLPFLGQGEPFSHRILIALSTKQA